MATENTVSKPLYDDEEEKRKRKVAEDYLKNRSAFMDSQRKDFTVDVPEDVAATMTDEQIKAEGTRRIGEIKTSFQDSFKAANEAGFKNAQAAEEYLNRGQARVVGDTLVGSAAGVSAREWDKRDKATASGNNPHMPTKEMDNVVAGGKVKMDDDTARVFNETNRTVAQSSAAASPTVTPEQAARNYLTNLTSSRAKDQADSIERYNNFRQGIETDRFVAQVAESDRRIANEEYRAARLASRGLSLAARRGKVVDPDAIAKASERLSAADRARGYGVDSNTQRRMFESNVRGEIDSGRLNPFEVSSSRSEQVPQAPASNSEGFSLESSFGSLLGEETEEQKNASKRLREIGSALSDYRKFYGRNNSIGRV